MKLTTNRGLFAPLLGALAFALAIALSGCGGGGGGGGDVEPPPPAPGGTGTGADNVPTFWSIVGWNVDMGSAYAVRQTSDGGFVAAGFQAAGFSGATPPDLVVLKTNATGTTEWTRRIAWFDGAFAYDVRQTADGGYMVVGSGVSGATASVVLVKLDASGAIVSGWPKTHGGSGAEAGYALQALNGGNDGYLIAGATGAGPLYVLRLDAAGTKVWEKSDYAPFCAPNGAGLGLAMTPTYDGNFVIAGATGCFAWAGFLLKIDAANGAEMWRTILDDTNPSSTAVLNSVMETADHSLVAAGTVGTDCGPTVAGTCDAFVVKTDSAGQEVWRRVYGGAAKDGAYGVALASDGNYLVAGYSHSYGGAIQDPTMPFLWSDAMLLKITPDGATVWHKIKGLRPRGADSAGSITATSDGGFAIGGSSGGDLLLAKFDKNGDTVNLGASYDLSLSVPTTQGTISFGNAVDVAGIGALGLITPHEIGSAMLDRLIAAAGGGQASAFCTGGGSYAFTPAVPATLAAGNSYGLTFTNCLIGPAGPEQTRINGTTTLTIDAVSGTPGAGAYSLQVTASAMSLAVDEPGVQLGQTYVGGLRIARTATAAGDRSETLSAPLGVTLAVTETSSGSTTRAALYGPYTIHFTLPASGAFSVGAAGDTLTASAGATFSVTVLQPIVLDAAAAQPTGGSYRVSAPDGSQLTATITSGATESSATLAVDTNGDGSNDGTLSVPWDFIY